MYRKALASAALTALTCAAVLTGCSNDNSTGRDDHTAAATTTASATPNTGAAQAGQHNEADITFALEMIPHHRQAITMAEMVPSRSTNPQVLDLATRIRAAQGPEITSMSDWLRAWDAPVPPPAGRHGGMGHDGMNHGGTAPMPGMMTDEQMAQLGAAGGAEFDRMWLTGMIAHHQGAIDMARIELVEGSSPDAKALAQQIIDTQQVEITRMRALLQD